MAQTITITFVDEKWADIEQILGAGWVDSMPNTKTEYTVEQIKRMVLSETAKHLSKVEREAVDAKYQAYVEGTDEPQSVSVSVPPFIEDNSITSPI